MKFPNNGEGGSESQLTMSSPSKASTGMGLHLVLFWGVKLFCFHGFIVLTFYFILFEKELKIVYIWRERGSGRTGGRVGI